MTNPLSLLRYLEEARPCGNMGEWIDQANCATSDIDAEMFHDEERAAEAIEICQGCPVTKQCELLRRANRYTGVWGGEAHYPRDSTGHATQKTRETS